MTGPFGVDLHDNIGSSPESSAPESSAPETTTELKETSGVETTQLPDLDKLDKFLFKGREWTRKEWEDGHLRQEDYTRKTQEIAQQRKYVENFSYDLSTVLKNPEKLRDFERIYPKEFVEVAKQIMQSTGSPKPSEEAHESRSLESDPLYNELKSELDQFKAEKEEARIKETQNWLDKQFESLGKKYSFADAEVVNARAHAAAMKGEKITAEVLDKLFKQSNEQMKKRYETWHNETVKKQINKGSEAKDMGVGGDAPSGQPKTPKTFKEATASWLANLSQGN